MEGSTLGKATRKETLVWPTISNLPQWQREKLEEHRHERRAESDPDRVLWTGTPKGELVTEIGHYWANVILIGAKYAFTAYSKSSGVVVSAYFDYETERDAMVGAEEFMRDGKHPRTQV